MKKITKCILFVVLLLALGCVGGFQLVKKVAYEQIERDLSMRLYDLKDEIGEYYRNHNYECPEDISEFESWRSETDSIKNECEFVGNRNVYRLKDGELQRIILQSVRTWKRNWPFGKGKIQALIERYRLTFVNDKRMLIITLGFDDVPPEEIVELETQVPREFFVNQTLGKDAPSQDESLKEQTATPETANGA
ncbi:MAG: hypothetical protein J6X44_05585 [Thermoguttaceae bacterium]|nr:hypothetical protein [Thermoguttaceae bacterium]